MNQLFQTFLCLYIYLFCRQLSTEINKSLLTDLSRSKEFLPPAERINRLAYFSVSGTCNIVDRVAGVSCTGCLYNKSLYVKFANINNSGVRFLKMSEQRRRRKEGSGSEESDLSETEAPAPRQKKPVSFIFPL